MLNRLLRGSKKTTKKVEEDVWCGVVVVAQKGEVLHKGISIYVVAPFSFHFAARTDTKSEKLKIGAPTYIMGFQSFFSLCWHLPTIFPIQYLSLLLWGLSQKTRVQS